MQPARDPQARSDGLHLLFPASQEAIRHALARLLSEPPLRDLSPDRRGTAELVLAEVLNNVAEHAYADVTGTVAVTLTPVAAGVCCQVVDQGAAMPDGRLPDGIPPATDTALADLPEGGFGWHLIRSLTRDLSYSRSGGCNRLSFLLPHDG
jgi:serine/threonine-protein kinase RsbW